MQWRRLGYFSFDPNERSRHEARELKSVHLNTLAAALRADANPIARTPSYCRLEDCILEDCIFDAESSSSADLWKQFLG